MELNTDTVRLTGPEKAAVLMMCLPREHAAKLMRELDDDDRRQLVRSITTLGMIPREIVERVIREFSDTLSGRAGLSGSSDVARTLLASILPDGTISEYMDELYSPREDGSVWEDLSSLNEKDIAAWMLNENDQFVAVALSRIRPQVAAAVLPLMGDRMGPISIRMITLTPISRQALIDMEETISTDLIGPSRRKTGADQHQRLAEMFNKMDRGVFESVSRTLEETVPDPFAKVKERMFVFDDLIRMDVQGLQRIVRSCENQTMALALKGTSKELRDTFMSGEVMTQRAREALQMEIDGLGAIRAREAQEAQNRILEIVGDLVRKNVIRLPSEEEKMIE